MTQQLGCLSPIDLIHIAKQWFISRGWKPFPFQENAWTAFLENKEGIINAPTGSGKTYAMLMGILLEYIKENNGDRSKKNNGVQIIWITPIRALAKEIAYSSEKAIEGLGLNWKVGIRSGDTNTTNRQKQWKNPPEILITTPESIHVIMCKKGYSHFFRTLKTVVVDEWHELMGSKRGVLMELALSRFRGLNPGLKTWGISATIGNMDESMQVLFGAKRYPESILIKSEIKKEIKVISILPSEIDKFPWTGHIGLKMLEKVLPIIHQSTSCLIFTNTRSMSEIWYQKLLEIDPELSGIMAMHHGSISRELRDWVEQSLHDGTLKAVVCTSSLDLGVDFRPVETIIQIGSPKSVARFMQRAGRSGHQPGAISKIYFVPTHSLEIVDGAALRTAIEKAYVEERIPFIRSFDVLTQFLMTLAVSEGFIADDIYKEIKDTFCFNSMDRTEWFQLLHFLVHGGRTFQAYDEFQKLIIENGVYKLINKKLATIHKLSIGTIASDASLQIRYLNGKKIGTIEEWFISQLNIGDTFWFGGRSLELVRIKGMDVQVRNSNSKTGKVPSWMGGRMSFSSELSQMLKLKMYNFKNGIIEDDELRSLEGLFQLQMERSLLPGKDEFLVEYFKSRDGFHLIMFPFEGRAAHMGLSALLASRISKLIPISFSLAFNDYGFELLSDQKIDVEGIITHDLFTPKNLINDIQESVNSVEMAKRSFRDIARISGLIFDGYPGKQKKQRHLQTTSSLIFDIFREYDPNNLLYLQTYDEVLTFQLEEARMRLALEQIQKQKIVITRPQKATPFSFPIMVDRWRERLSSESLLDRIEKMKNALLSEG